MSSGRRLCSEKVRSRDGGVGAVRAVAPAVERAGEAALAGAPGPRPFTPRCRQAFWKAPTPPSSVHDDDRLVEDLVGDVVGRGDLLEPARHLPRAGPQLLGLEPEEVGVVVALLRHPVGRSMAWGTGRPSPRSTPLGERTRLTGRYNRVRPGTLPDTVDVLVIGAGITGIYQLYRAARPASRSAARGRRRRRRHLVLEPLPRCPLRLRELHLRLPLLAGAVRRVGVAGALRRPARDRALPQPRGRPVRPPPPHPLRRPVTSAVWDEASATWGWRPATAPRFGRASSIAATGVLSVPYLPDVPGATTSGRAAPHRPWPGRAGRRRRQAGRGRRHVVERRAGRAGDRRRGRVAHRVPAHAPTGARRSTTDRSPPTSRPSCGPASRRCETLNTSIHGLPPHGERARRLRRPRGRALAFFERMWASPGFMKLTSNYVDILINPAANAEWCEFIAEKIRGVVDDPDTAERLIPEDHRYGEKRPPFVAGYFEAFNQPTSRWSTCGDADRAGHRDRDRDDRRRAGARRHRVGDRLRLRHRRADPHGDPRPRRPRAQDHWAGRPDDVPRRADRRVPQPLLPGGPHAAAGNNPRYNGDQVDFVTDLLVRLRAAAATSSRSPRRPRTAGPHGRQGPPPSPFGTIGQYVVGNIPGKPQRYLLNAAGRPKLFTEIAERGQRLPGFGLRRRRRDGRVTAAQTVAIGVSGEPTIPGRRSGAR